MNSPFQFHSHGVLKECLLENFGNFLGKYIEFLGTEFF